MPYKTVWDTFSDGAFSWKEPRQVWVEPTPEEKAAQEAADAAHEARGKDLLARTEQLIADMKAVGL